MFPVAPPEACWFTWSGGGEVVVRVVVRRKEFLRRPTRSVEASKNRLLIIPGLGFLRCCLSSHPRPLVIMLMVDGEASGMCVLSVGG